MASTDGPFVRGDANVDGVLDMADAQTITPTDEWSCGDDSLRLDLGYDYTCVTDDESIECFGELPLAMDDYLFRRSIQRVQLGEDPQHPSRTTEMVSLTVGSFGSRVTLPRMRTFSSGASDPGVQPNPSGSKNQH